MFNNLQIFSFGIPKIIPFDLKGKEHKTKYKQKNKNKNKNIKNKKQTKTNKQTKQTKIKNKQRNDLLFFLTKLEILKGVLHPRPRL